MTTWARFSTLLFLCFVSLSIGASTAWAHGDPPEGEKIYAVDGGWVYVTNFGVMDAGHPHEYVCEEAFFASESFHVAPLAMNRWVTFSRTTVAVTDDGCDFERTFDLPAPPIAIAAREASDEVAFVTRESEQTILGYSDDGGWTWRYLDIDLDDVRPSGMGFVGDHRLALVGHETDEATRGTAALVELDVDADERTDLETDGELNYPELLATSDDGLLWHARRSGDTEVYWSRDGEIDFAHLSVPSWPTSGALAEDGTRAYLGGIDSESRGVFEAHADEPSTWEEIVAGHRALCMTTDGDDLWVCGHRNHDDHDLARYNADDGLQGVSDFRDLQGYRSDCPDDSRVNRTCPSVWPEFAPGLGIEVDGDGGDDHDHDDHDDHDHDDHDDHDNDDHGDHDQDDHDQHSDDGDESSCSSAGGSAPGAGWWLIVCLIAISTIRMRLNRRMHGPPNLVG